MSAPVGSAPASRAPTLLVASVQCDIAWEDRDTNLARLQPRVAAAADAGAGLVLLPEMFATGFSMRTDVVAEGPEARTATWIRERASSLGVAVGGSFACRVPGSSKPVNRFLLALCAGDIVVYDKIHPFRYGGEDEHYAPGTGVVTADVGGVRVTPLVCYDLRFADTFWDAAAATDCYVVVASWPSARQVHWRTLLAARAIENQAYVVGVNRVGRGGGVHYCGGSVVVGPFGEAVAEGGDAEEVVLADVDPRRVADVRSSYPFLADR